MHHGHHPSFDDHSGPRQGPARTGAAPLESHGYVTPSLVGGARNSGGAGALCQCARQTHKPLGRSLPAAMPYTTRTSKMSLAVEKASLTTCLRHTCAMTNTSRKPHSVLGLSSSAAFPHAPLPKDTLVHKRRNGKFFLHIVAQSRVRLALLPGPPHAHLDGYISPEAKDSDCSPRGPHSTAGLLPPPKDEAQYRRLGCECAASDARRRKRGMIATRQKFRLI